MIQIKITVDGRTFTHELADGTPRDVIQKVIDDRLSGIPSYFDGSARIVSTSIVYGHGPVRRRLEAVADAWLSVEPVVRIGLYLLTVAILVTIGLGW